MFKVNYYLNDKVNTFDYNFATTFAATIKARAIYMEHGIPSDVVDMTTGEVMAIFSQGGIYLADAFRENTIPEIVEDLTAAR